MASPKSTNDNQEVPNPELRDHVTSQQFVLTLTKYQIQMLIAVGNNDYEAMQVLRNNVSFAHQLKRRGLVLHNTDVYGREKIRYFGSNRTWKYTHSIPNFQLHHIYRLTRAGWAVYDLLVEAGLAQAIDRRARRMA